MPMPSPDKHHCAPKIGVVVVTVVAAFDLPVKDKLSGSTDPYVELSYVGQSQ